MHGARTSTIPAGGWQPDPGRDGREAGTVDDDAPTVEGRGVGSSSWRGPGYSALTASMSWARPSFASAKSMPVLSFVYSSLSMPA